MSWGKIAVYTVLLTAIAALLIPVVRIENDVLQHTRGTLTYPRDNAFVGMTVARNLAFYKVWGITKYSFQSASASPLYTLLLAAVYFIVGEQIIIPLIINLLAAVFFLVVLQRWLIRRGLSPAGQLLLLLLVVFGTPLPPLAIGGMEHILQLLFSFLFIRTFAESVRNAKSSRLPSNAYTPPSKGFVPPFSVYIYAFLMVMTGYECIIPAILAAGFLCWRRQWSPGRNLAIAAFLPIGVYGLISLSKGGYFLPNPLLLRSAAHLHAETWLIGNAIIFLGCLSLQYGRRLLIILTTKAITGIFVGLALLAIPLCLHSIALFTDSARECIALYRQQYPAARFVHRYYYRYPIAVNEPGVISYWSEGRKLDFTGLTDHAVMSSRRTHSWSPAMADSLSRREGVRIAILSDTSSNLTALQRWKKVAAWQTKPNNSNNGNSADSVSFYAADTATVTRLRKNLMEFQPSLPAETIVRYY